MLDLRDIIRSVVIEASSVPDLGTYNDELVYANEMFIRKLVDKYEPAFHLWRQEQTASVKERK